MIRRSYDDIVRAKEYESILTKLKTYGFNFDALQVNVKNHEAKIKSVHGVVTETTVHGENCNRYHDEYTEFEIIKLNDLIKLLETKYCSYCSLNAHVVIEEGSFDLEEYMISLNMLLKLFKSIELIKAKVKNSESFTFKESLSYFQNYHKIYENKHYYLKHANENLRESFKEALVTFEKFFNSTLPLELVNKSVTAWLFKEMNFSDNFLETNCETIFKAHAGKECIIAQDAYYIEEISEAACLTTLPEGRSADILTFDEMFLYKIQTTFNKAQKTFFIAPDVTGYIFSARTNIYTSMNSFDDANFDVVNTNGIISLEVKEIIEGIYPLHHVRHNAMFNPDHEIRINANSPHPDEKNYSGLREAYEDALLLTLN